MTLLTTIASFFFLTAGVALICVIAVIGVNAALRKTQSGFHELESLLAHVFGAASHPTERAMHGLFALFLSSWAATIAFFLARIIGALPEGIIGFIIYALVLVLLSGFALFPMLGYGVFGRGHHPRAPYWIIALVLTFSVTLAICTSLLF